jgi:hypothetical protein
MRANPSGGGTAPEEQSSYTNFMARAKRRPPAAKHERRTPRREGDDESSWLRPLRLNAKVAAAKQRYLTAWRWRRTVEAELSAAELTFTQWLVLEALHSLVVESGDASGLAALADGAACLETATLGQQDRRFPPGGRVTRPDRG